MVLIVDTDLGCDDIVALLMLRECKEFKYISLTNGMINLEEDVDIAVDILRKILTYIDREDINIIYNTDCKVVNKYPDEGEKKHSLDTLEKYFNDYPISYPEMFNTLEEEIDYLKDEKVDILCLGALTNIASIINKPNINKLYISGTSYNELEYNMMFDPYSAKIVFDSKLDKVIVPLETTSTLLVEDLDNKYLGSKILLDNDNTGKLPLFDVIAVMGYLNIDLFEAESNIKVDVDKDGNTKINEGGKDKILISPLKTLKNEIEKYLI